MPLVNTGFAARGGTQKTLNGNTKGFWKTHGSLNNYVTSDDKQTMVDSGEVFTITHVSEGQSQFGPKWNVHIIRAGHDGEMVLSFAKNDARNAMMQDLRTELLSGYIDASLTTFPTNSGNYAYALCPPSDGSADEDDDATPENTDE